MKVYILIIDASQCYKYSLDFVLIIRIVHIIIRVMRIGGV